MVPIPARMKHLQVDRRGYPIPWGVYRDGEGNPHFAINDEKRRMQMLGRDLCSICGTKLFRGRWFVGGPLSAFHEYGCYLDPPMHHECATFALQVCPYLSAPSYAGRVDDRTLRKTGKGVVTLDNKGAVKSVSTAMEGESTTLLMDTTMIPERPQLFVAVMAIGQMLRPEGMQVNIKPNRPYRAVEYWRNGQRLPTEAGELAVQIVLNLAKDNKV